MNKIDWQTGTPLESGSYLVTLYGGIIDLCDYIDGHWNADLWFIDSVIAWCPIKDIQPYVEPKFKIGEIVVENGIIGTITAMNNDGTYLVVGAALMPMTFTPSMCRLATPDEALSLSAKWRERGKYYDIKTNELKKL